MNQHFVPHATEIVVADAPLTIHRKVRWAECDPAGVVYAGNFPDYMLSAVALFKSLILRTPLGSDPEKQPFGTPAKAMEMVYHSSLWPDDEFAMKVYVGRIGTTTMHLLVEATRVDNGNPIFSGRLSSIYINREDRTRSIPIPDTVAGTLRSYQAECGSTPDGLLELLR